MDNFLKREGRVEFEAVQTRTVLAPHREAVGVVGRAGLSPV
jgi:hypothetical protein